MKYCMIIVTFPDRSEADKTIDKLLEESLIACAQMQDINSRYVWKGEIVSDNEVLVYMKTRAALYDKIEEVIKSSHSYEVPEIICVPIEKGLKEYLDWIDESVN